MKNDNLLTPPLVFYRHTKTDIFNNFLEDSPGDDFNETDIRNYYEKTKNKLLPKANESDLTTVIKDLSNKSYTLEEKFWGQVGVLNLKDYYSKESKTISKPKYEELMLKIVGGEKGALIALQQVSDPTFISTVMQKFSADKRQEFLSEFLDSYQEYLERPEHIKQVALQVYGKNCYTIPPELQLPLNAEEEAEIATEKLLKTTKRAFLEKIIPSLKINPVFRNSIGEHVKISTGRGTHQGTELRKANIESSLEEQGVTSMKIEFIIDSDIKDKLPTYFKKGAGKQVSYMSFTQNVDSWIDIIIESLPNGEGKAYLIDKRDLIIKKIKNSSLEDEITKTIETNMEELFSKQIPSLIKKLSSPDFKNSQEMVNKILQILNEKKSKSEQIEIRPRDLDNQDKKNDILKKLKQQMGGYESKIKGSVSEIFFTSFLQAVIENVKHEGSSLVSTSEDRKTPSYQAHADTSLSLSEEIKGFEKLGMQIKVYSQYKLYNVDINLNSNYLEKYIGEDGYNNESAWGAIGLQFLILNRNFFNDGSFDNEIITKIFQSKISNIMRLTDELEKLTFNIFYVVNGYIIPTSIILNRLEENLEKEKIKNLIQTTGDFPSMDEISGNPPSTKDREVLNLLENITQTVTFKGFTVNPNTIIK